MEFADANPLRKLARRFAASVPGSWLFARFLHHIDRPMYKLTNGRYTLGSIVSGLPIVLLTTTGAKTAKPRTVPVLGVPTDDGMVVIASNFGQYSQPGWYYNLRANPDGELTVNGDRTRFRAVEATGERRERIWQTALRVYPGWSQYERRAAHRPIVVFVLETV